jgi:hypothetical protein
MSFRTSALSCTTSPNPCAPSLGDTQMHFWNPKAVQYPGQKYHLWATLSTNVTDGKTVAEGWVIPVTASKKFQLVSASQFPPESTIFFTMGKESSVADASINHTYPVVFTMRAGNWVVDSDGTIVLNPNDKTSFHMFGQDPQNMAPLPYENHCIDVFSIANDAILNVADLDTASMQFTMKMDSTGDLPYSVNFVCCKIQDICSDSQQCPSGQKCVFNDFEPNVCQSAGQRLQSAFSDPKKSPWIIGGIVLAVVAIGFAVWYVVKQKQKKSIDVTLE